MEKKKYGSRQEREQALSRGASDRSSGLFKKLSETFSKSEPDIEEVDAEEAAARNQAGAQGEYMYKEADAPSKSNLDILNEMKEPKKPSLDELKRQEWLKRMN